MLDELILLSFCLMMKVSCCVWYSLLIGLCTWMPRWSGIQRGFHFFFPSVFFLFFFFCSSVSPGLPPSHPSNLPFFPPFFLLVLILKEPFSLCFIEICFYVETDLWKSTRSVEPAKSAYKHRITGIHFYLCSRDRERWNLYILI